MSGRTALLALLTAAAALPAAAQDRRSQADQIRPAAASDRAAPAQIGPAQIGAAERAVASAPRAAPATAEAPAQLVGRADSGRPTPQLSAADRNARGSTQLSARDPSSAGSQALSSVAQGRTAEVSRVAGADRCDAAADDAAGVAFCQRVIETRSAEFRPPETDPLTPEQRLLATQRVRERPADARTAARRLGVGEIDENAAESQNVASIVLSTPEPDPRGQPADASGLTAETVEALSAILGVSVQPQQ